LDPQGVRQFTIYPGRCSGAKPFGSCGAKRLASLSGWVNAANPMDARYYDLGSIKLDCDLGNRVGWFGVQPLDEAEVDLPTMVQGYPADKTPAGRQWVSNDRIRTVQSLKAFYQNDTWGGMGGSPVYTEGDATIFALHTNGLHDGEPWSSTMEQPE
jgi:V8-like Glu-specific endopeptidase